MSEKVAKSDWHTKDMPKENTAFIFTKSFSQEQLDILALGHIPVEMEDKWFWYTEEGKLYAHRSWTGTCIFTVEFRSDNNHIVTVNLNPEKDSGKSFEEYRNMIERLLEQWSMPSYDYYREWISETLNSIEKNKL